jgi:O-antigen/teichoic acid export membrane protein
MTGQKIQNSIGPIRKPRLLDDQPRLAGAKIKRNAFFNVLRVLIYAPIPLLLTPYIIHRIGAQAFGIWAVLYAMANLTSLADFGLVGTLSKHVAEYWAKRDLVRLNKLINTGLVLFGTIALLASVTLALLQKPIFALVFRQAHTIGPELIYAYYLLIPVVAFNILSFPLSSIATGLQRMDVTSLLSSANIGSAAILSFMFLHAGYGLTGLMAATLAGSMIAFTANLLLVPRLLPMLTIDLRNFSIGEMRTLLAFSSQLYVVQMAVAISNNVEKFLLSRMCGALYAGWYEVASDFSVKVRSVPGLLLTPLLSAASDLHAHGDEARLAKLYQRAHKYLAMIGIPIVVWTFAVAPAFVFLWLGPAFNSVILPIRVLVPAQFLNLATGPGTLILLGKGYARPATLTSSVGLVVNLVASGLLIWRYGFAGAFIGTTIAMTFSSVWGFVLFHRYTKYPFWKTIREAYLKPILCSILLAISISLLSPPGAKWLSLISRSAIFGVLYLVGLVLSRFFDSFDIDQIPGHIRHSALGKILLRSTISQPAALALEKSA